LGPTKARLSASGPTNRSRCQRSSGAISRGKETTRRPARDLDQDTLARYRRVLGEDHPDTLASASNLARDLRNLDEITMAPRSTRATRAP